MNGEPHDIRVVRLHKRWADGYTLLTQIVILLLFTGIYLLFEQSGLGAAERAGAFALLGTMILAAVIWQAAGLGIARIHLLLDGVDLEARAKRRGQDQT